MSMVIKPDLLSTDSLKSRYEKLAIKRHPFLERSRECAELTQPYLMMRPGQTQFVTPWQGIGSRGVNNLAAKLLLALLPPNSPFFRLVVQEAELVDVDPKLKLHVDEALTQCERLLMTEIETGAMRVGVFEALKHLIVTGNSLIYLVPEGGIRVFHLDQYVIRRDPAGHALEIIVHEKVDRTFVDLPLDSLGIDKPSSSDQTTVDLFTSITWQDDRWHVLQEVGGVLVPESKGTYPKDCSPWLALRFIRVDGEDYGRGLVEEYLGDLKSLETLTKAIVEGSAAAAKVLFLVKPNSTTKETVLAEAPNGAIRSGNAEDVTVLQVQKYADFRVARETMEHMTQRLSYAFLLNSSIQRQGERVTAEEIRHMAGELEDALGGVYSILSQEFQLPLILRLMHQMERRGLFPKLPKGMVRPMIVTGLEALGRGHDLLKLQSFVGDLASLGQALPEILMRINPEELIKRLCIARGLDAQGLILSEEELMQKQAIQQQAQMQAQAPMLPGLPIT